ncbi:hypothetical protein GW17_00021403 [Ensete ventricosum]|nr:hypothetical protein GW17_00021403 [Ensete ventricosum]
MIKHFLYGLLCDLRDQGLSHINILLKYLKIRLYTLTLPSLALVEASCTEYVL